MVNTVSLSLFYCLLSLYIWRINCDVNEISWPSIGETSTSGSTDIGTKLSLFDEDRLKRAVAVKLPSDDEKPQVENHRKIKRCRKNRRQRKMKLKCNGSNDETENNRDNSIQSRYRKKISSAETEDERVRNTKKRVEWSREFRDIGESSESPFLRIAKDRGSHGTGNAETEIDSFEENGGDVILKRIKNHLINPGDYKVLALVGMKDDYATPQSAKKYVCYCKEADCSGKECQPEIYKPCSGSRQNSRPTPYNLVGQVNNYGSNKGGSYSPMNAKIDRKNYGQTLAKVDVENSRVNYKGVREKENSRSEFETYETKSNQNTRTQESTVNLDQRDKLLVQNSQQTGIPMQLGVNQIRPVLGLKVSQGPSQEFGKPESNANLSWLPFLKDQSTKGKNQGEVLLAQGQVPQRKGCAVQVPSLKKPVPNIEKSSNYLGKPEPRLISNGESTTMQLATMESNTERYQQSEDNDSNVKSIIGSTVSSEEDSSNEFDASTEGKVYLQVVDGQESNEDTKDSVPLDPRVSLPQPGNQDDDVYLLGDSSEEESNNEKGVSDTPQKYELPLMMSKNDGNRLETDQVLHHRQIPGFKALPPGSFAREYRGPYNGGYGGYQVSPNTWPGWNGNSVYLPAEIPFRTQLERPAIARSGWNGCNSFPIAQLWTREMIQNPNNYYGTGIGGPPFRNFGFYENPNAGKLKEDSTSQLLYYSPTMKTGNGGAGLPRQRYPVANDNRDDYSDIQVVTNGYFTSKTYDDVEDPDGNEEQEPENVQAEFESNVDRIHHLTHQGFAHDASNLYNGYKSENDWKVQTEKSRYFESVEDDEDEMEYRDLASAEADKRIIIDENPNNILTQTEQSSLEESSSSEEFIGENLSKDDEADEDDVHQIIDLPKDGNTSSVETVGETKTGLSGESDSSDPIEEDSQPSNEELDEVVSEKNISPDGFGVLEEETPELVEDGSLGLETKSADSKNDNDEEVGSYYKSHCNYPADSSSGHKYSEYVSQFSPPIIVEPVVAIETSPTKYFSPNDRVLEYIKNHGQNLMERSDSSGRNQQGAVHQEDRMDPIIETNDEEAFVQNPQYGTECSQMSSEDGNNEEMVRDKSGNLQRTFTQPIIPGSDEVYEDSDDSTEQFNDDAKIESAESPATTSEHLERSEKDGMQDKIGATELLSQKNEMSEDLSRSYDDCTAESVTSKVFGEAQYPDNNYRSESIEESTEYSQLEDPVSNDHLDMENYGSESMVENSNSDQKENREEDIQQHGIVDAEGGKDLSYEDNKRFLVGEYLNPTTGKNVQEVNSQIETKPEEHVAVENNGMQLTAESLKLGDKTNGEEGTAQHRVECEDGRYSSSLEDNHDYEDENLGDDSNTRKDSEKLGAVSLVANEGNGRNQMSSTDSLMSTPSVSCSCRVPEIGITTEAYRNGKKLLLGEVLEPTVGKDVEKIETMDGHNTSDDKVNDLTEIDLKKDDISLSEFNKMQLMTNETKLEDEKNLKDAERSDDEEDYEYENSGENLSRLEKKSEEIDTVNSTSGDYLDYSGRDNVESVTRSSFNCNNRVPGQKSTTEGYEESRKLLVGEFLDSLAKKGILKEESLNTYGSKNGELNPTGNNPTPVMIEKGNGFVGIQSTTKNSKMDDEVNGNVAEDDDYERSGDLQDTSSLPGSKNTEYNFKSDVGKCVSRIPSQESSTMVYEDSEKILHGEFPIPAEEEMLKNKALNEDNGEVEQMSNAKNPVPKIDAETKGFDEEAENYGMQSTNNKSKVEDEEDYNVKSDPENSGEIATKNSEIIGVANSLGSCIKPPEVQDDFGYFGRIAPKNPTAVVESFGDLADSDLYYIGDGVRLPLTIKRLKDGSFALSISEKICQEWAKKKCPCCVPREGKILQEKHSDEGKLDSIKKTSRRDIPADVIESKSDEVEVAGDAQLPKKRSARSITMPVDEFAEKYNLNLNLDDVSNAESKLINNETSTRRHKVTERSEMENDTQTQSSDLVQKIVSINEVPENERVGVLLSTLQELIATEPTEISAVVDKLEENMAKEKLRGEFGGDVGEENASGDERSRLYDYQKDNPVLERIKIIKQLQIGKRRCEHKYQKDCDYAITQKTELLKTILRWLKELLVTSQKK